MNYYWKILIYPFCIILTLSLVGCDPEGKKQCVWELEAEPDQTKRVEKGYIPVCARNRTTMKQDCRLQASLEFAKKAYGKVFRFVDMNIKSPALPRTITDIKFCTPKRK